jgi:hypothetical protein
MRYLTRYVVTSSDYLIVQRAGKHVSQYVIDTIAGCYPADIVNSPSYSRSDSSSLASFGSHLSV